MPERFNGQVSKTLVPVKREREFESHSHRQSVHSLMDRVAVSGTADPSSILGGRTAGRSRIAVHSVRLESECAERHARVRIPPPPPMIKTQLIAPCGMNCGICKAYLRQNHPCHGCRDAEQNKPQTRANCYLRVCDKRKSDFCYGCTEFPCDRLEHLDKRYKTKYQMSPVDNLKQIKELGLKNFIQEEEKKWACKKCGGIICVHTGKCANC